MANTLLTDNFSEPLNQATTARVDVNAGDGNLTIDRLAGSAQELANGTLQYFEKQGVPTRTLDTSNGQTTLTLKGGVDRRPRFRLPWSACNGGTEWHIHLNPTVSSDITAHSNGGNVKLNLAGMVINRLSADTGGGNMDVVLPDNAANLNVVAKSGGGNVTVEIGDGTTGSSIVNAGSGAGTVTVYLPGEVAARILATTGLGKVIVDPRFKLVAKNLYQSSDFDAAGNKVEITAQSGAGNVNITAK